MPTSTISVPPQAQYAAEIIAKMKAMGISEIRVGCVFPPGKNMALVCQAGGDVLLRLTHAPGEVLLWFYAPSRNTLIGIGEPIDTSPFYKPMPPTAVVQLAPLWSSLGINYQSGTTTDLYQDPTNLTAVSGICKIRGTLRSCGAYLLVINKTIRRIKGLDGLQRTITSYIQAHYGKPVECYRMNNDYPVSPPVVALPLVKQALASGIWPLLVTDGQLDHLLAAGCTWQLLPW